MSQNKARFPIFFRRLSLFENKHVKTSASDNCATHRVLVSHKLTLKIIFFNHKNLVESILAYAFIHETEENY